MAFEEELTTEESIIFMCSSAKTNQNVRCPAYCVREAYYHPLFITSRVIPPKIAGHAITRDTEYTTHPQIPPPVDKQFGEKINDHRGGVVIQHWKLRYVCIRLPLVALQLLGVWCLQLAH